MIVQVHIGYVIDSTEFFIQTSRFGYQIVCCFFLLSGYGLTKSIIRKGGEYLRFFWRNASLRIILPYLLIFVIWFVVKAVINDRRFDDFTIWYKGSTYVPYAWFIYELLMLYLIFYIVFKYCSKMSVYGKFLLILIASLALNRLLRFTLYHTYWYLSIFGFVAGVGISLWEGEITAMLRKHLIFILMISIVGYSICIWLNLMLGWITFTAIVMYTLVRVNPHLLMKKGLTFLGKISYYIYLCQMPIILPVMYIDMPIYVKYIVVYVLTIGLAIGMYHLFRPIQRRWMV